MMHMQVMGKQKNSRMCIICGLDNTAGVQAPFYNMEDGSVMTLFRFRKEHQSYPGRVHGGMITAMLDELGLRALWVTQEECLGVTTSLESKYRKPVPYDVELLGRGIIAMDHSRFLKAEAQIFTLKGQILAQAQLRYLKLTAKEIQEGISYHEEMCYSVPDSIKELPFALVR